MHCLQKANNKIQLLALKLEIEEMKAQRKLILASLGLLCFFALLVVSIQEGTFSNYDNLEMNGGTDKEQIPQKVMNFTEFKRKFSRGYSNAVEEMARSRIYLHRTMQVFIYSILYKIKKSKSYLAVNQFSDRTPKELWKIIMSDSEIDFENIASVDEKKHENFKGEYQADTADINMEDSIEVMRELDRSDTGALFGPKDVADSSIKARMRRSVDKQLLGKNENMKQRNDRKPVKSSFLTKILNSNLFDCTSKKKLVGHGASNLGTTNIDHRSSGCFFPPRDQGYCWCGYAFAAIAYYEWAHCIASDKLIAFSEQYIVDCGPKTSRYLNGCQGGSITRLPEFIEEFGFDLRENYPYIGQQQECPFGRETGYKEMGYIRVPSSEPNVDGFGGDEIGAKLKESPILINIKVNQLFFDYGGGVDLGNGCRETKRTHSVLIIGDGKQDDEEYWLIRNSFSSNWGEKGYYKLSKFSDCLEPRKQGYLFRPQFSSKQEENFNENYDGYEIRKRREQFVNIKEEKKKGKRRIFKN